MSNLVSLATRYVTVNVSPAVTVMLSTEAVTVSSGGRKRSTRTTARVFRIASSIRGVAVGSYAPHSSSL